MGKRQETIELIARALITFPGKILLCRSRKHGYYYLPGGHVEFGERAADAIRRELKEEAGLKIRCGPLLLTSESLFEQRGRSRHEVNLVFHVERASGGDSAVDSLEPDIGFEWLNAVQLEGCDLRPKQMKAWLIEHLAGAEGPHWLPSS